MAFEEQPPYNHEPCPRPPERANMIVVVDPNTGNLMEIPLPGNQSENESFIEELSRQRMVLDPTPRTSSEAARIVDLER